VQYSDYAAWQRERLSGERLGRELGYWRRQLGGLEPLELPADRARPAVASHRGGRVSFQVSEEVTRGLREVGRSQGATLFMVALAGFQALLARYSGQRDVAVGAPVAGRERREFEGLIGFFINTVVLRTDLTGDPTFAELVGRAREVTLGAYAHGEAPFEKLVEELQPERDLSRAPLFQVMVSYLTNPLRGLKLPGLSVGLLETNAEATKFDLTVEMLEDGDSLSATFNYSEDLFDRETVVRMAEHFQTLLAAAATEPEQRLSRLPLLGDEERRRLLVEWNATATAYPNQERIHQAFERQVELTPDAIALVFQDEAVSYRELNRRANQLAHHLRGMGVGVETLVGICAERSVEMPVGLLGILKAGGAYLPLDPESPRRRLEMMVADAGINVVLTQQRLGAALAGQELRLVYLDGGWSEIAQQSNRNPASEARAENLAYVMYTSGSTGEPKGVSIMHRSVLRLVLETDYIRIGAGDRIGQAATVSFDAATFEIWGALLNGAAVRIVDREELLDAECFARWMREESFNILFLTTALFNRHAQVCAESFGSLDYLLFGGEAVDPRWVRAALEGGRPGHLLHVYGPTESTTFATWHEVENVEEGAVTVPIGRPLNNTTVYVLDEGQQPAPTGVVGELCIGGDGLARGYLNRPAPTAERFIPHLYAETPGERLYRTGDRVRNLRGGEIEFVGRLDEQVKLRGFRVEPGEIKHVLEQHAAVREAEVVVRGTASGDKRLVAYIVREGTHDLSGDELRDFVGERLPRYMAPSAFVTLEEMPLTRNGKVDRRALPEPLAPEASEFVAPRTPTEEIVAGIWSSVLGTPRVGLHEDFFQLGGHSLLATQVVSRLREAFKVEVGLRALFANPTVSALAELIEQGLREGPGAEVSPVRPRGRDGRLPLSLAQQRLWFLDQLEPGNVALNMSVVARFRGPLDAILLERALSEVIGRHEILRATMAFGEGGPFQVIAPHRPFTLPLVDLCGVTPQRRVAEEGRLTLAEAQEPFDLSRDQLLRARLLRLDDAEHVFLFTMHHIVSDGWSMRVLLREVQDLYGAYAQGRPSPLPELTAQYTDYAAWQRELLQGEELARQLSYWREQLAGAPSLLQLPTDRPRPSVQTFSGQSHTLLLDAELRDALLDLSRGESATLFMTLLAAFEVLLQRLSGQDDFLIGAPIAGRNRAEIEGLIGFFINSLALRTDLTGDPTFRDLLRKVRERTLGAYGRQDVPFEKVLEELQPERTLSHTPLFQVFFNMLNLGAQKLELPGVQADFEVAPQTPSKFDLTLYVEEQEDGIALRLVYNSDLFAGARMVEMLAQYKHLLTQVVREPEARTSSFSLVTPSAREALPDPLRPLDDAWVGSVHALFSERARRSPRRLAVSDKHGPWTYGELDARSSQLAHFLCSAEIEKGEVVAVYSHRSAPLVWALLGIMKAGAAFVLIDPTYPTARIVEYLQLVEPRGWLQLEEAGPLPAELKEFVGSLPLRARLELPTRADAEARGLLREYSTVAPEVGVGPDDLAYLSFTSGTTGRPKAILGRHGPLTHFLPWLKETFGLDDSAAFTMLSGLSHDPLHRDVFTPLQLGGRISIPDPQMIGSPGWLARWMRSEGVTVANLTPAMGRFLLESSAEESAIHCLRHLFFVGDMLTRRDVALFRRLAPAATCINFYGSTETQRSVSYHVVPAEQSPADVDETRSGKEVIPLGRGIRDVQLLLLNAGGGLAGVGEVGEIYFRSPHLARGYKGDAALTEERFVTNPFSGKAGDRLYRTGDLGRYMLDGGVEPLGRRDAQVKVRGYRVELGEIESVLAQHPAVGEAAVIARADETGERWLAAYVIPRPNAAAPGGVELREYLRQRLPDYMAPASYVALDKLPLTPNGKLDRAALPTPEQVVTADGDAYAVPRTPAEKKLTEMWAEVLRLPKVRLHDNFFDLGGHSLLGIQLMSRMRQEFRVEIPLRALFETPTVAALSSLIERGSDGKQMLEPTDAQVVRRKTKTIEELFAELE
jgi:amino acid adenylation domain-containing protein